MTIIHSTHPVDHLPLCMPVAFWDDRKVEATDKDSDVTCQKCKDVLEQIYREIGRPE